MGLFVLTLYTHSLLFRSATPLILSLSLLIAQKRRYLFHYLLFPYVAERLLFSPSPNQIYTCQIFPNTRTPVTNWKPERTPLSFRIALLTNLAYVRKLFVSTVITPKLYIATSTAADHGKPIIRLNTLLWYFSNSSTWYSVHFSFALVGTLWFFFARSPL